MWPYWPVVRLSVCALVGGDDCAAGGAGVVAAWVVVGLHCAAGAGGVFAQWGVFTRCGLCAAPQCSCAGGCVLSSFDGTRSGLGGFFGDVAVALACVDRFGVCFLGVCGGGLELSGGVA